MTLSLEQLSARMRQGEDIPLSDTARIALALSIPSILEQLVVTAMEYIDAAMVGHIGAEATAAIGIVSSSTWLLHGILVGLYTAFSIQIAQYLGADRQQDARGVLRQSMLFNLILGLGAAAFGVGISRFLPGWLGADISLQAAASAYFAIWSAALPFTMAMGMYTAMLRATGDGVYGVQAGHNPVLVALHMGIAKFTVDGETREVLVGDGIAEVTPTFVLLLVDSAERPEDIDRNRAEAARIRAEERLQHKQSMHEYYQSKIALDRAMQRLQTAAKYKR